MVATGPCVKYMLLYQHRQIGTFFLQNPAFRTQDAIKDSLPPMKKLVVSTDDSLDMQHIYTRMSRDK